MKKQTQNPDHVSASIDLKSVCKMSVCAETILRGSRWRFFWFDIISAVFVFGAIFLLVVEPNTSLFMALLTIILFGFGVFYFTYELWVNPPILILDSAGLRFFPFARKPVLVEWDKIEQAGICYQRVQNASIRHLYVVLKSSSPDNFARSLNKSVSGTDADIFISIDVVTENDSYLLKLLEGYPVKVIAKVNK